MSGPAADAQREATRGYVKAKMEKLEDLVAAEAGRIGHAGGAWKCQNPECKATRRILATALVLVVLFEAWAAVSVAMR
jgi:hypothetical protein